MCDAHRARSFQNYTLSCECARKWRKHESAKTDPQSNCCLFESVTVKGIVESIEIVETHHQMCSVVHKARVYTKCCAAICLERKLYKCFDLPL